jgi:glucans biosynthesis protein
VTVRKALVWGIWFWLVAPPVFAQTTQTQITFDVIIQKAKERAEKPFRSPKTELPEDLKNLNYDSYREIHFRHDRALWAKEELPFRLEFFHPGYLYDMPVKINEFNANHTQPIRFVEDFFDYGNLKLPKKPSGDSGYAGFRLLFRLNAPDKWDEVASFLGASYFRMLGQGQRYGSSARGLALNSGEVDVKEEFPAFTDWWLGKPEKGVDTLRLYALLDSASCAGAYEFLVRPGETTFADVNAVLFLRGQPSMKTLGLAPLTSMFWFGENSERKPDDFRPEVHDSDGLLIRGEQEELWWQPLNNGAALRHRSFATKNVKGFGLLQRDRDFSHYEDLYNFYNKTPAVWVEPRGNWGEGEVNLVELPTNFEGQDNIVAFWNPKERPAALQPFKFAYTLHWAMAPDAKFAPLKVLQTRVGAEPGNPKRRQVMIDFGGADVLSGSEPQATVRCGENAAVADVKVVKNEAGKTWRVIFGLTPKAENVGAVDIECSLNSGGKTVSEIWRYQWNNL